MTNTVRISVVVTGLILALVWFVLELPVEVYWAPVIFGAVLLFGYTCYRIGRDSAYREQNQEMLDIIGDEED